jgi:hypothetical protein
MERNFDSESAKAESRPLLISDFAIQALKRSVARKQVLACFSLLLYEIVGQDVPGKVFLSPPKKKQGTENFSVPCFMLGQVLARHDFYLVF